VSSFALVVNPVSGKGAARRAAQQAARHLRDQGLVVEIHETEGPGEATEWVRTHQEEFSAVVAIGGDGTLREVIEGLDGNRTVGLVPTGTANVVSRDLRIPRTTKKAVRILAEGHTRHLDMGTVNGRPFLAMVGVGFDGAIVKALSDVRCGPISMASYIGPGLRTFRNYQPQELRVEVDSQPLEHAIYGIIVSNTRNYGGVFSVTPGASLDDGWLDFHAQSRFGKRALLRYAMAAALRRETSRRLSSYGRGRRFSVTSDSPVAVQVDGDTFGTTPIDIELVQSRVRILVPDRRITMRTSHESNASPGN